MLYFPWNSVTGIKIMIALKNYQRFRNVNIICMKSLNRAVITTLLMFLPLSVFSQNWMMAQQYATTALDSIMDSDEDGALDFISCEYSSFAYNPVSQEYILYLHDNFMADLYGDDEDSTDSAVIYVKLNGGTATFENDIFNSFDVKLPDWSDCVFLWNGTDDKISFSLSCNNSEFSTYTLEKNTFNRYHCDADFVYIKLITLVSGAETGRINYKLIKGKGYKVEYDSTEVKFEVFSDDRLN